MHRSLGPPKLTLAIIADIHNGPVTSFRGNIRKLGDQAMALAKGFVGAANGLERLDAVVHLGDAIEDVDVETDRRHYSEVVSALRSLRAPVLHVTGNHDNRKLDDSVLYELRGATPSFPITVKGVELLMLRTYSGKGGCFTTAEDLALLEKQLDSGSGAALVFAHHGLADQDLTGNPWFEHAPHLALVDQRDEARGIMSAHDRVRAVFNGHLHWNSLVIHKGRPYFTIHSLTENIAAPNEPPVPAAAWALVELWEEELKVTVRGNDARDWSVPADVPGTSHEGRGGR